MNKPKLIRITTVPISLKILLKGQHLFMSQNGFEVVGVSSSGQELQDVEREENIRTIAVEMTRTISPLKETIQHHDIFNWNQWTCKSNSRNCRITKY